MIKDIASLRSRNWQVHVLREGNRCADFLARMGSSQLEQFMPWESPSLPCPIEIEGGVDLLRLRVEQLVLPFHASFRSTLPKRKNSHPILSRTLSELLPAPAQMVAHHQGLDWRGSPFVL